MVKRGRIARIRVPLCVLSALLWACSAPEFAPIDREALVASVQQAQLDVLARLRASSDVLDHEVASVSPDGRRILFESRHGRSLGVVEVVDPARIMWVGDGDADFGRLAPAWSPSGDRIAFVRLGYDDSELVIGRITGGGVSIATRRFATAAVTNACWSPDGSRLALAMPREADQRSGSRRLGPGGWGHSGKDFQLHIVSPEGTTERVMALPSSFTPMEESVEWSPTGSVVAILGTEWESTELGLGRTVLVLTNAETGQAVRTTQLESTPSIELGKPQFSPDGKFLAVSLNGQSVYVMAVDAESGNEPASWVDLGEYTAGAAVWNDTEPILVVCGFKEVTPIVRQMVQAFLGAGGGVDRDYEYRLWLMDPQTGKVTCVPDIVAVSDAAASCKRSLEAFRLLSAAWER